MEELTSFEQVKERLDQIVDLVKDDSLPLEEALSLYEEAVSLGLNASNLMEEGIAARNAQLEAEETPSAPSAE